ncbi:MAG TPA: translocation/assembly module TamB domain-containing protein [Candidatus Acidoferrum sp.]|nr:translocation/assembly module TamB domain-containing protein [Candidatus Acidoferrum sp.]
MKFRWKHGIWFTVLLVAGTALAVYLAVVTGFVHGYVRHAIVRGIEEHTGARVEMKRFHLRIWSLKAEIDGLTLHGLENSVAPPLFHADRVDAGIRIDSFFARKYSVDELVVERPELTIRVDADGHSNVPRPKPRANSGPWQDSLFKLQISRLELHDGAANFNNRRVPLSLEAHNFDFTMRYNGTTPGDDVYLGTFRFEKVHIAERHDTPFAFDVSGKFTLHRNSFDLDELACKLPHSELNLRGQMPSFERPDWDLWYRGRLSLEDVATILHAPTTPGGIADFSGQAHYATGQWTTNGYYDGHDIRMPYLWFHASGMRTWGDYEVAQQKLVVPNLRVTAFGGFLSGKLDMDLQTLAFRTETQLRGASLSGVLAALDNPGFPVRTLHWDGLVDVDSVNTWSKNFKHFETKGETRWSPPPTLAPGMIPASAKIDYDYSTDRRAVEIREGGEISMPKTQLSFYGPLGAADSGLELKLHTDDLHDWDDFINILRGPESEALPIGGRVDWRGRILGPLGGPTFTGHMQAANATYDKLYWDTINGDLEYSPDDFRLTNTDVRRGRTSATMDLVLHLDGAWSFLPSSTWSLEARLDHSPTEDLQKIFEMDYPVSGLLTGTFHGGGTRASPVMDGDFVFENIDAKGMHFDRLTGNLHLAHDEVRLSNADLRRDTGRITGEVTYHPGEQTAEFNVSGTGIALERIGSIQSASIPIGGELNFDLRGSGPLRAPAGQGDLHVLKLRLGTDVEGDFHGQLVSDGRNANVSIDSESAQAKLHGQATIGLGDDQPISGKLSLEQFDLDPFIVAGLHLKQITKHSSADGVFTISGALRQPDSIEVVADVTRISFDYELVRLTNDQDIRLTYHRNEVRIDQAHLHGPDTDLQVSGSARFDRDRPLRLAVQGVLDLRLLAGFLPDFETQGQAKANVSVGGTMSRPRITGRASVHDASASYADFPVGLSKVNGDIVFDESRLLFDRLTAESGGGQLTLSGNVVYGEGGPRYEVNVSTPLVRIRYPVGMSWLAGGSLQLSGSSTAALLSGRIQVQRLLFAQGVDVASFFATASETTVGPPSGSTFLRNLSFDIEGRTAPGAQIQWTGAQVGIEGDVRLRGTWDRPILLGNVHLLGGQMAFRGNNFDLTRGDINFANPFRLDPVLNVEATSTIAQYQVTINFSGPASRLSMTYRSDPPLPDSDIIALLALGSPGEEAGLRQQSASSQNYGATALLSEAISTGIGGRIEHLFGISQFRVDPFVAGTATESNAAARVTIQEQVARDLTITYSTNAATTNQYQLIQVQYDVSRELSVEFLRDINGTYGFDIKWVKHVK